jgi:hypothetical protein
MTGDRTASGHSRERLARHVRAVNPRRLADWNGWSIAGTLVNPYFDYSNAYHQKMPRAVQIADLLVGDVFVDTLLHPELKVASREDGSIIWPHRGRKDV